MATVKHGKNIKTEQDLQSLVIGVINRQTDKFTQENIVDTVKHFMKDSVLKVTKSDIIKVVSDNLDYLYRKGLVNCACGIYTPQAI